MTPAPAPAPIVFANRVYWPDEQATAQLLTDLAEGLAARGWPVTVLTARIPTRTESEVHNGVTVRRLGPARGRASNLVTKAAGYLRFAGALRRELPEVLPAARCLVALTDPPFLGPLAAAAVRRRRVPLVHLIQDIHPEVAIAVTGNPLLRMLGAPWIRWRDRAWREADQCVTISRDMAGLVRERGVADHRTRIIRVWAPGNESLRPVPPEDNALRRTWGFDGKYVVAYSGNLGRVHALEPLVTAAAMLRDLPDLVIAFIGDGPRRAALESEVARRGVPNVRFLPAQPRDRLAESLSVGDVHLVTLRSGCERCVFPSKLYGVLAVGRPVVFVGPPRCELAAAVQQHHAGLTAPDNDPAAIAGAIRSLAADPARRAEQGRAALAWHRETGGLSASLDAWERLLHTLAPAGDNSDLR